MFLLILMVSPLMFMFKFEEDIYLLYIKRYIINTFEILLCVGGTGLGGTGRRAHLVQRGYGLP